MKRLIITLSCLIVVVFSYQIYRYNKVKNLFDEIYYNQKNTLFGRPALERVDTIYNPMYGEPITTGLNVLKYKAPLPSHVTAIGYTFNFETEIVSLEIRYDIGDKQGRTINLNYDYQAKTKTLIHKQWFLDGADHNHDKASVEAFLSDNGYDIETIQRIGDDILREKIIPDWLSVYNSRYTVSDWGEIELKSEWDD